MKKQYLKTIRKNAAGALIVITSLMQPLASYGGSWQQSERGWQYNQDHEVIQGQWISDQGLWYHLDQDGWMQDGWHRDTDGHWYYLNRSDQGIAGSMRTGWYQDMDGSWYYLNPQTQAGAPLGAMRTGWIKDGDVWYFLGVDGRWLPARGNAGPGISDDESGSSYHSDDSESGEAEKEGGNTGKQPDGSDGEGGIDEGPGQSSGNENPGNSGNEDSDGDNDGESGNSGGVTEPGDDGRDSDGDGLTDMQETYYRTDSDNPDTDGDGLTDGEEVKLGTAPLRADTDADGIDDGEEIRLGTDPLRYDTDNDGLSDQEELLLETDPCNPDTNGNSILDGDELSEVILQAPDEDGFSGPAVEVLLPQKNNQTVTIEREDPETSIWAPKEMPGLIGAAYEFEADGEIEGASLTFYYPEELNDKEDFNPAIYFIDTLNQEMVELENQMLDRDRCMVQAGTDHFSMYALVDKSEQAKAWEVDIEQGEPDAFDSRIDVIFVLDESGSMVWNDPSKIRVSVCRDFLRALREGDRAGIIGFGSSSRLYQSLDSNLDSVSGNLDYISNHMGGTNISSGISRALEQFSPAVTSALSLVWNTATASEARTASDSEAEKNAEYEGEIFLIDDREIMWDNIMNELSATSSDSTTASNTATTSNASLQNQEYEEAAMKLIILLTDGSGTYSHTYTQAAIEQGIKIYTVGLGSSYNEALLKKIAADTGAKYYHADSAEELVKEFADLTTDAVDILTDSDDDGLSDYHEERIRLFNGTFIWLNKYVADMDDDGLLDGEEIVQTTDQYGRVFFKMHSHPNRVDSDGDEIQDAEDVRPLFFDIVPTLITDTRIEFNTGRSWNRFPALVTAYQYYHDAWGYMLDGGMRSALTMEECAVIADRISGNKNQKYAFEELQYIALMDVEGARVYLDDKTPELRKQLYESLVERESKTYRYQGRFASQMFVEVDEGTEGGFWSGKVIAEYDLNLSMRFYYMDPDGNDIFDAVVIYGSACTMAVLAAELSVVATANIEAIQYYCKNWGIKEGLSFYRTLGTGYVPNGILSQIQLQEEPGTVSSDSFTDKSVNHLKTVEGFNKTRGGIKGGHKKTSFFEYFNSKNQNVKVVSKTTDPHFPGLEHYEYQVAKGDGKGGYYPNDFVPNIYEKTLYTYSDDEIVAWGKEALNGRTIQVVNNGLYVKGTSNNGMKFEGWINSSTNELDSFYPVLNWTY